MVLVVQLSSEGSNEPVHLCSLDRAFPVCTYKVGTHIKPQELAHMVRMLFLARGCSLPERNNLLTLILPILFFLKILSVYYVCCIHSNALENYFIIEANTMKPDQSPPQGNEQSDLDP